VELCVERPELRSGITAYIVSRGLVDAAGNRLFEDSDAQKIGAAPSPLFARLAKEILRLSRVAEEDIGKLEKNLPPTRSGSGG
jgi:hypothetical protein